MTPYLLATIAGGIVMGLWFDRLVEMARSRMLLFAGLAALAVCLLLGQEWAGIALGCILGTRVLSTRRGPVG
jgi:biotin transporter BioY